MRDTETFIAQTKALGLRLDDAETAALAQMVGELDEMFRPVDEAERVPSEDPFDFMRVARELRERRDG
ncbi:MAG TPA: hypothetical protein VH306_00335 [Gaiellaceae bacterium]|jgi:hypothetical protein